MPWRNLTHNQQVGGRYGQNQHVTDKEESRGL